MARLVPAGGVACAVGRLAAELRTVHAEVAAHVPAALTSYMSITSDHIISR